ncbi:esterase/lipase family protein [Streptomyces zagrosensis]|uniref:Pimeloyl-ACP methyl ester carboxylesterase n=1 Tax=Streptomyces zagrosensis TaxID=1042984 RepID=A0A7W9QE54_9ACTN|nr:hypothetical protein [Streptomyces zagrosensis]MBB5938636.1 pimeloyl-ACP methyl ester carboxylesterase [Streptomyces zagrosensis]
MPDQKFWTYTSDRKLKFNAPDSKWNGRCLIRGKEYNGAYATMMEPCNHKDVLTWSVNGNSDVYTTVNGNEYYMFLWGALNARAIQIRKGQPNAKWVPYGVSRERHARPVVFVHGYKGDNNGWGDLKQKLKNDKHYKDSDFVNYDYGSGFPYPGKGIAAHSEDFQQWVYGKFSGRRIDVVTHSMGSLVSRYAIRWKGVDQKVDKFISYGGPNHGATNWSALCPKGCPLEIEDMKPNSRFINGLNGKKGNETWPITYMTIAAKRDELVPPDRVAISGSNVRGNYVVDDTGRRRGLDFPHHEGVKQSAAAMKYTLPFLAEGNRLTNCGPRLKPGPC